MALVAWLAGRLANGDAGRHLGQINIAFAFISPIVAAGLDVLVQRGNLFRAIGQVNIFARHISWQPRSAHVFIGTEARELYSEPDLLCALATVELLHPVKPTSGLSGAPVRSAWTAEDDGLTIC